MAPYRGVVDPYTLLHMLAGVAFYYVRLKELPFLVGHGAFQIWPQKSYRHPMNFVGDFLAAWMGYSAAKAFDHDRAYDSNLRREAEEFARAMRGGGVASFSFFRPVPHDFPGLG